MAVLCAVLVNLLIGIEAATRGIDLSKKHEWSNCVHWMKKNDTAITSDPGKLHDGILNGSKKYDLSDQHLNLEEAPLGTMNKPMKIQYDYSNDSDSAMDDALFSYVDQKFPDVVFPEEDYSGFFILTRSGYEYESLPAVDNSDVNIQDTIDLWNNSYVDLVRDFQANEVPKSIFLPDTRVKITDTKKFPYSAIGLIESGCTGTFVGPRHVLTAGHCVYDAIKKRWRKSLNIRRAKNCDPGQGVYHTWKYAIVNQGWRLLGLPAYDYAMIVVNEVFPSFMDVGWLDPVPQSVVNINGYPGDKSGHCMWGSKCNVVWQSELQLGHRCDTYYGMSGSSVYIKDGVAGRPVVYCVHAYGRGLMAKFNKCTRITETRSALIKKWVESY